MRRRVACLRVVCCSRHPPRTGIALFFYTFLRPNQQAACLMPPLSTMRRLRGLDSFSTKSPCRSRLDGPSAPSQDSHFSTLGREARDVKSCQPALLCQLAQGWVDTRFSQRAATTCRHGSAIGYRQTCMALLGPGKVTNPTETAGSKASARSGCFKSGSEIKETRRNKSMPGPNPPVGRPKILEQGLVPTFSNYLVVR